MPPRASVAVVLAAHRPFVERPELDPGLVSSVTGWHLPLLDRLRAMRAEGVTLGLTVALSPPLCSMLRDARVVRRIGEGIESDDLRRIWEEVGRDVVGAYSDLEQSGHLEMLGGAASHGVLPLLADSPRSVPAQIAIGCQMHLSFFGRRPRGFWLPACAFSPGIDEALAVEGIRFFVVDELGIERAAPRPLHGIDAPVFTPSGVAAFGRNVAASAALAAGRALAALEQGEAEPDTAPIVVAACDVDGLGPNAGVVLDRLERLCRSLATDESSVRAVTLASVVEQRPVAQRAMPSPSAARPEGSWEAWLAPENAWMRRHAHHASCEMTDLARGRPRAAGLVRRALDQAARELLLLEASDWSFGDGPGRFRAHLSRFRRLGEMIRADVIDEVWLSDLARRDAIFPEMDYHLYA